MDKPVEPDLQAIYENIIEAFRKHGYGDWLEIAAKKTIEATIKYVGVKTSGTNNLFWVKEEME